jgi:hypothetical protein
MSSLAARLPLLGQGQGGALALRSLLGGNQGLFLDFLNDDALIVDGATPANNYRGKASSKLTFTRASSAWRFNSAGLLESVASDVMRIDYDPVTKAKRGLLMEVNRTNLLLNSDALSTQSVTVTAAAHTLSFYGTGTVTLSGASTAGPLTGSAYPNRSSLTFTPSAGTLTLTVSGSVQFAQLELGAIPSSYIPTAGATVTRAAEVCKILTSAFPATTTGPYTLFCKGIWPLNNASDVTRVMYSLNNGSFNESRYIGRNVSAQSSPANIVGGASNVSFTPASVTPLAAFKLAVRHQLNDINFAVSGALPSAADTVCAVPLAPTQLNIGNLGDGNTSHFHGWIQQIAVIPTALVDAQLQAVTA